MAALDTLRLPAWVQQHLFATAVETAQALAAAVAADLNEGLHQRSRASLVVCGGRTPALFQDALSSQSLDWSRVTVSLTDERWVPADHADRNERQVRRHLLQGAAAAAQFIPLVNLGAAPEQHLATLQRALSAMPQPFDAVVLGMGEDGHTASLFPGAPGTAAALDVDRPERVAFVTPASAPHRRISLTLRALLDARAVMILIQGEGKRAAIEWAAQSEPATYPIAAFLKHGKVPVHLYFNP